MALWRNTPSRRHPITLAAVWGAVTALSLAVMAQASAKTKAPAPPPPYVFDATFPVTRSNAPDYPYIDVTGVAVGLDGRIYITQGLPSHNPVLVFDRAGHFLFTFGGDQLQEPHTVRCDPEGNLWITDFDTHLVTKWTPNGQLIAAYGVRHSPSRALGHFSGPNDVAFAPNGDIYVAEGDGEQVVRLAHDGTFKSVWGVHGKKPGQFGFPHSIAVDAQNRVYVADRKNKRIEVFTADGQFLYLWKNSNVGTPWGLFITPNQTLYVADGTRGRITGFDLNGNMLWTFGKGGRQPGQFHEAHQICVDSSGVLYEADASGKRVQRFLPQ